MNMITRSAPAADGPEDAFGPCCQAHLTAQARRLACAGWYRWILVEPRSAVAPQRNSRIVLSRDPPLLPATARTHLWQGACHCVIDCTRPAPGRGWAAVALRLRRGSGGLAGGYRQPCQLYPHTPTLFHKDLHAGHGSVHNAFMSALSIDGVGAMQIHIPDLIIRQGQHVI